MCQFSKSDRAKLGNAIVYMSERIQHLHKTKLLKLLYLMEESMVKAYHIPFLALPYEVWRLGPVQKDVFVDLSQNPQALLSEYITMTDNGIQSIKAFDDTEFSDAEIGMMDSVIRQYGHLTGKELIDILHRPDGLWYKTAERNGLLWAFQENIENNSDIRLDLSELLDDCEKDFYKETLDIQLAARSQRVAAYV